MPIDYISTSALYGSYLAHHGIKGQKWGRRRYQNEDGSLTSEGRARYGLSEYKSQYRNAYKDYKNKQKAANRAAYTAFGRTRIAEAERLQKAADKARYKAIDAKAAYKVAKAKPGREDKAEMRVYRRAMQRTGIRGSALDISSDRASSKLYDHITTKKGKEYADQVEKRVQNVVVSTLVGATAVSIGSALVSAYMLNR